MYHQVCALQLILAQDKINQYVTHLDVPNIYFKHSQHKANLNRILVYCFKVVLWTVSFLEISCIFHCLRNEISEIVFSNTPLGPRPERLCFELCVQCCLSTAFLLSAIAGIKKPQLLPNPLFEFKTYTLLVRYILY